MSELSEVVSRSPEVQKSQGEKIPPINWRKQIQSPNTVPYMWKEPITMESLAKPDSLKLKTGEISLQPATREKIKLFSEWQSLSPEAQTIIAQHLVARRFGLGMPSLFVEQLSLPDGKPISLGSALKLSPKTMKGLDLRLDSLLSQGLELNGIAKKIDRILEVFAPSEQFKEKEYRIRKELTEELATRIEERDGIMEDPPQLSHELDTEINLPNRRLDVKEYHVATQLIGLLVPSLDGLITHLGQEEDAHLILLPMVDKLADTFRSSPRLKTQSDGSTNQSKNILQTTESIKQHLRHLDIPFQDDNVSRLVSIYFGIMNRVREFKKPAKWPLLPKVSMYPELSPSNSHK